MKISKLIMLILIISLLATILVYNQLPDQVPRHWNINGQVDSMANKPFVFFTALLPVALYLFFILMPKIDPKKENYQKFQKPYYLITLAIILMLVAVHWLTIAASLGWIVNVAMAVKLGVGILFIILGNVMPKLKFNYFVGIRTPWTLANEEVWRRTHRVGGVAFVALGALTIALAFFQGMANFIIFMSATLGLVAFTFIYSFLVYRKVTQ